MTAITVRVPEELADRADAVGWCRGIGAGLGLSDRPVGSCVVTEDRRGPAHAYVPFGASAYFCSLHSFEEDGVKEGMVGTITIEF
jgi:hypothetical protein